MIVRYGMAVCLALLLVCLALLLWLVAPAGAAAQCVPPACVNNVAGKVLMLSNGPAAVQLVQPVTGPVNLATDRIEFTYDTLETAQDAEVNGTLPCPSPFENILTCSLVTPTVEAAAAMTIRASVGRCFDPTCTTAPAMFPTTVVSPTVAMIDNITCSATPARCVTAPLARILPNLGTGGVFLLRLSRERLPNFHESVWSDPVIFLVPGGDPLPLPKIDCVPGPWDPWSAWLPLDPQIVPPMLTRIRTREIVRPAANGGIECSPLLERELMLLTPPAIPKFCRYIKAGTTTVQTIAEGTVISGTNQMATQSTRMAILVGWGFELNKTTCLTAAGPSTNRACQTVHVEATCRGLP